MMTLKLSLLPGPVLQQISTYPDDDFAPSVMDVTDQAYGLCCRNRARDVLPLTRDGFIPRVPSRACRAA